MPNPNNGPSHGRFRNTMQERYHNAPNAQPFMLSPEESTQFGIQARNLRFQNKVTMATLGQQARDVRTQYREIKRGALSEGRAALGDVAGDAADRGMVGSSVQVAGEQGVVGETQNTIGSAYLDRTGALQDINLQRLAGVGEFRMGLADLALTRAARKRTLALAAMGSGGANPWGY